MRCNRPRSSSIAHENKSSRCGSRIHQTPPRHSVRTLGARVFRYQRTSSTGWSGPLPQRHRRAPAEAHLRSQTRVEEARRVPVDLRRRPRPATGSCNIGSPRRRVVRWMWLKPPRCRGCRFGMQLEDSGLRQLRKPTARHRRAIAPGPEWLHHLGPVLVQVGRGRRFGQRDPQRDHISHRTALESSH